MHRLLGDSLIQNKHCSLRTESPELYVCIFYNSVRTLSVTESVQFIVLALTFVSRLSAHHCGVDQQRVISSSCVSVASHFWNI